MMKKGLISILFLLIANLCFSQDGYPKRINDSLVTITMKQLIAANNEHLYHLQYKELSDSLLVTIDSCRSAFWFFRDSDSSSREIISIQQSGIEERDTLITTYHTALIDISKENKKLHHQKTLLSWSTGILIGITVILYIL